MGEVNLKEGIVNNILKIIEDKIILTKRSIISIEESRNNETKSSAGDKYETGRAMMQMEKDKCELQLMKLLDQKNKLTQLPFKENYDKVEVGSLVNTTNGNYYISIGIGKLSYEENIYFVISPLAPIGQLLINKSIGDKIEFRESNFTILDIK